MKNRGRDGRVERSEVMEMKKTWKRSFQTTKKRDSKRRKKLRQDKEEVVKAAAAWSCFSRGSDAGNGAGHPVAG